MRMNRQGSSAKHRWPAGQHTCHIISKHDPPLFASNFDPLTVPECPCLGRGGGKVRVRGAMFDDRLVAIDHRLEDVLAEIAAALKP